MAMDPRNYPRGAPPDFNMDGLPPNPNPQRITNQLWWLRCMRLRLEPLSADGGILAIKPGYHSYGSRLPNHGLGDPDTDHSIRRAPDRSGKWWRDFAAAHDWTFTNAHHGDYTQIKKYCNRLRDAMRDPKDLRPDDVYAYFIGQIDDDPIVEGYNEYRDAPETGNKSHLWHRHDSFRRNIVGSFPHMWQALTIDMGWTYAEWQRSVRPQPVKPPRENNVELKDALWDRNDPPAWAGPYVELLTTEDGTVAHPTVLNLMLHTMRHAAEARRTSEALAVELAAVRSELRALTQAHQPEQPPAT
jgi:hypothetical protein